MGFEGYFTLIVVAAMIIGLTLELAATDSLLFAALGVLMLVGIVSPDEALAGFSNQGMITIGLLFFIIHAIESTGVLDSIVQNFSGKQSSRVTSVLMLKMMVPITLLSAFVNNTPVVVIFTPIVKKWAERLNLSASKFLLPLSYATIFGGMCTLIGTSTNLVVHGLMLEHSMEGLSMFELAQIGIPCTLVGWAYLAVIGDKLLPNHKDILEVVEENRKEYVVEIKVQKNCNLIGKTIAQAGLRELKGLYLVDIERQGQSLGPVASDERINPDDHLIFAGITSAVIELYDIPGLVPVEDGVLKEDFGHIHKDLFEAVVSSNSPVLGKTVKQCNFRSKYGAAVIAVHRNGERIKSKIGSILLKPGDTLLLLATKDFTSNWKNSQDFYLISNLKSFIQKDRSKTYLALGIVTLMVLAATFGRQLPLINGEPITMLHAALGAVILLSATGCLKISEARKSIRWNVLISIACALGISNALQKSGVADSAALLVTSIVHGMGSLGALAVIYLLTAAVTEIITNAAAAALVFPIAISTAAQLNVNPKPFIIAVTIAASASFVTPIGYQTNLIVQGAGGYKFGDFVKIGLPLSVLFFITSMLIIPCVWRF